MPLFVVLALLTGLVVVVAALAREIRTDGYGHHESPRSPSAFDPRMRLP